MPTPTSDDTHARMDRLEQRLRQMRASDGGITWDDFDGSPMASLLAKRELEALRQRLNESVTSVISRWREKIALIIDHSLERDHICMIMRSLQLRFAKHLMGFTHADFRSLVQALYDVEEGISQDGQSLALLILRERSH
ncbi:hypothetical protein CK203_110556 [Vitis vinifera]|uniref:Uncharacterized protein n=1 Tax=Vitis vinifera TaxID=29760 RepID=A0A438CCF0_VITVI|nr:hypothetical protein CK203_110556 [Vitis vinifera]